mgnify:CR=1 FL=1
MSKSKKQNTQKNNNKSRQWSTNKIILTTKRNNDYNPAKEILTIVGWWDLKLSNERYVEMHLNKNTKNSSASVERTLTNCPKNQVNSTFKGNISLNRERYALSLLPIIKMRINQCWKETQKGRQIFRILGPKIPNLSYPMKWAWRLSSRKDEFLSLRHHRRCVRRFLIENITPFEALWLLRLCLACMTDRTSETPINDARCRLIYDV